MNSIPDTGQSGSIERQGVRLRYCTQGSGTPVLVIGSSVYYPRTFSARLREHCRISFADMRHFAEATESAQNQNQDQGQALAERGDYRDERLSEYLNEYLNDIEALRCALGLERFVLLGHSHHGNLALEYACRFPDRVTGLVLVGSPPCNVADTLAASEEYWRQQASAERQALLDARRAALPADANFIGHYVADAPLYWHDPAYDAGWLWQGVPINLPALNTFKQFFVDYDFAGVAARIRAPVLVINGDDDYIVPPLLWDTCPTPFSALTRHCLERSGHTPQLEEPDAFDRHLLNWLGAGHGRAEPL